MLGRIDAFQMRGSRYILEIEHAYYSRVSNKEVHDKINILLNHGADINITWQEAISANHFNDPKQVTIERLYNVAAKQDHGTHDQAGWASS